MTSNIEHLFTCQFVSLYQLWWNDSSDLSSIFKTVLCWEPAVSVMAMSLDSHVVDRGPWPGPGGLKLTPDACACVPKIPRGEWRRRDYGVTIPPGGWFLTFCLSVSLSFWLVLTPYSKNFSPPKQKKRKKTLEMKLLWRNLLVSFLNDNLRQPLCYFAGLSSGELFF